MALYHEHRPQTFASVLGQEHIITTLEHQIAGGKPAHAYLFSGPRGVGKTTTARVLAKALNCQKRKDGKSEPCNACSSCQEISASRAIDVIEIDAASHTGVDNVRENIIENAQFKPTASQYKVFIIDEVHMLSTSSFNALLKTLEEPPAHVIFILATTDMQKLPETIVSRCQRFQFKKIPFDTLGKHLHEIAREKKVSLDEDVARRIVKKSDGCARDAVSLLDQIMATGEKKITPAVAGRVLPASASEDVIKFVASCIRRELQSGLDVLHTLNDNGANMTQFLSDSVEALRSILLKKNGGEETGSLDLTKDMETEITALLPLASSIELIALIDAIMRRKLDVRSSPIPILPAELILFERCADADTPGASHFGGQSKSPVNPTPSNASLVGTSAAEDTAEDTKEPSGDISRIDIERIWPDFLLAVEKKSSTLVFVLKMAEIKEIRAGTVVLAVQFQFHRDKIMEKTCHRDLENLLSIAASSQLRIDVTVDAVQTAEKPSEAQELAALLGGQVV